MAAISDSGQILNSSVEAFRLSFDELLFADYNAMVSWTEAKTMESVWSLMLVKWLNLPTQ